MAYAPTRKRGMARLESYGTDMYAAIAALNRALGVLTASPQWIMGSLLGNINFAAWLGVLFDALLARKDSILRATGYDRVREVGETVKGAAATYARMSAEEKMRKGMEFIRKFTEIRAKISEILGPVKEVLEAMKAAAGV